ncbi:MAG TPA: type IV pili twitching motility protein PilT [Pseudothermotoga sp.]|uniref:type IV pilus twitching motility protein PilT n=1 Tax=Pseudothermotoga lettingae TaxID=177758 RepID=UPI00074927D6|nr:type IV pilus twitching motility protein PilT [Pseudothermotoga lettingae]KUK21699.1 MAG: Twitching motility protein [Pseudothermotoga lettingae]HBT26430.1 type IV pili twitching motility protein PilT [Pseudothermotoga sp.]
MIEISALVADAFSKKASDIHLSVDMPPIYRINGLLVEQKNFGIMGESDLVMSLKKLFDQIGMTNNLEKKEIDFAFSVGEQVRVRGNLYYERRKPALALRLITRKIRTFDELGLPDILKEFTERDSGLILVAGPTGSGKSTTLAAMIDYINENHPYHIITIEDPIEYIFTNKKSIIHQRELGQDTNSFYDGLKYALRQDPDVILVGEMRDLETMSLALTAAETGHLVFSTIHTNSAASAPERVIDVFPAHQQKQIALQLANTLIAIIYQRLLPRIDGKGMVPVLEILVGTPAVKNLIRENKLHQIESIMQTSSKQGMVLFDDALFRAYMSGLIDKKQVYEYARNQQEMGKKLG